jgi:hypothetical protein
MTLRDLFLHLTLCQNGMFFDQTVTSNMKCKYCQIIIDPQIDENITLHQK